jgi:hypothetical protein
MGTSEVEQIRERTVDGFDVLRIVLIEWHDAPPYAASS